MALAGVDPAFSADFRISEPKKNVARIPYLNWSGFYAGGHLGYGRGHATDRFADWLTVVPNKPVGSLFGGVQFGYNHVLNSGIVLGAEGDLSFPNFLSGDDVVRFRLTPQGNLSEKIDYVGRLRGRFGYVFDNRLVYGTGGSPGLAPASSRLSISRVMKIRCFACAGAGCWALGPKSRLLRTGVRGLNTSTIILEKPASPCRPAFARKPVSMPIRCDWG